MTKPNDEELEQYLKGGTTLSRRYRDASREKAPTELDEQVLALARAETRRKPRTNRWLPSLALAASAILAVNLAWNLREQAVPASVTEAQSFDQLSQETIAQAPVALAPQPVPPAAERLRDAPAANTVPESRSVLRKAPHALAPAASGSADASSSGESPAPARLAESEAMTTAKAEPDAYKQNRESTELGHLAMAADSAPLPLEARPALTEPEKIERLIQYIGQLQGAVFIRNGTEHTAPDAAEHLRLKLKKAGNRIKTAGEFIELCATRSSRSGEVYRIKFADGTTRPAGEVLREHLRGLEGAG